MARLQQHSCVDINAPDLRDIEQQSIRTDVACRNFTIEGQNVNKTELIDQIAEAADISKASAGRALDAALDAITDSLKKADPVALVGFGTFTRGH